ncbi:PREDICTED: uncharacterized protein LOC104704969 [Camelina sativa]|uniref:Uncharacterized protein LOC104704969 n=1 Tax=Camelina sativa TaxID=90675 RepID=A0ABM0T147_CAMSA|nr:PREDICTED: uncharacterized protein LOC104704969 [Camelina sativa]
MDALAMAGVEYQEWGLSIEEWELQESVVPPHLLADDSDEEEEDHRNNNDSEVEEKEDHLRDDDDDIVLDSLEVKQVVPCVIKASVGKLIEQSLSYIPAYMIVHLKQLKFLTLLVENFLLAMFFIFFCDRF